MDIVVTLELLREEQRAELDALLTELGLSTRSRTGTPLPPSTYLGTVASRSVDHLARQIWDRLLGASIAVGNLLVAEVRDAAVRRLAPGALPPEPEKPAAATVGGEGAGEGSETHDGGLTDELGDDPVVGASSPGPSSPEPTGHVAGAPSSARPWADAGDT